MQSIACSSSKPLFAGHRRFDCAFDCSRGDSGAPVRAGDRRFDHRGGGLGKMAGGVSSDSLKPENDFEQKNLLAEWCLGASRPPVSFQVAAPLAFMSDTIYLYTDCESGRLEAVRASNQNEKLARSLLGEHLAAVRRGEGMAGRGCSMAFLRSPANERVGDPVDFKKFAAPPVRLVVMREVAQ